MKELDLLQNWLDSQTVSITEVQSSTNSVLRVCSNDLVYYLKKKNSLDEVVREVYFYEQLAPQGIRVPAPMKTHHGGTHVELDGHFYCLYTEIPGEVLAQYSEELCYTVGEAIARLHLGLKTCSVEHLKITEMNVNHQMTEWALPAASKFDSRLIPICEYLKRCFLPITESLPQQIIHRDLNPSNMIFENGALSGMIDFDISTFGIRIFDPCYFCTAMLMHDFHNELHRKNWVKCYTKLMEGYQNRTTLLELEKEAILPMLLTIQFIFVAYFSDKDEQIARLNKDALVWLYENRELINHTL